MQQATTSERTTPWQKAVAVLMAVVLALGLTPGFGVAKAYAGEDDLAAANMTTQGASTNFVVNQTGSGKIKVTQSTASNVLIEEGATTGSCPDDYYGAAYIYVTEGEIDTISVSSDGNPITISDAYLPTGCYGSFNITGTTETITVRFKDSGTDPSPSGEASKLSMTLGYASTIVTKTEMVVGDNLGDSTQVALNIGSGATYNGSTIASSDYSRVNLQWFYTKDGGDETALSEVFHPIEKDALYGGGMSSTNESYNASFTPTSAGTYSVYCKGWWQGESLSEVTPVTSTPKTITVREGQKITVTTTPAENVSVEVKNKASNATVSGYNSEYLVANNQTYTITAMPTGSNYNLYNAKSVEWTSSTGSTVAITLDEKQATSAKRLRW